MKPHTPKKACRLLAVDVDGTLLHRGTIDRADAEALRRAARAGMVVCVCTGRSWPEVQGVWRELALPVPAAPVVCVGGAVVVEPHTGRSLYSRPFDLDTADELAGEIRRMGFPVMAIVDRWREDFDYYLIGGYEDRPLYRKFFDGRDCRTRRVERLNAPGSARPLRISLLAERERAGELAGTLRRRFAGRVEAQTIWLQHLDLHIVEAFAAGTNKFTAVVYVGQGYRLGPKAMAAIGDDYNDLPMLEGVSVSAAPADAPAELRRAASVVVGPRGRGGVAEFVELLLAGREDQPPGVSS